MSDGAVRKGRPVVVMAPMSWEPAPKRWVCAVCTVCTACADFGGGAVCDARSGPAASARRNGCDVCPSHEDQEGALRSQTRQVLPPDECGMPEASSIPWWPDRRTRPGT